MKPRVLVVTGNPADWGWLEPVVVALSRDASVTVVNVGTHVVPDIDSVSVLALIEHDRTHRSMLEVYRDTAKALSLFLEDIVAEKYHGAVLLGDRIETLTAAIALNTNLIPVHHLSAGDVSGCLDDNYRDAISMLSTHLYATARSALRRCRLMQELRTSFNIKSSQRVEMLFDVDEHSHEGFELEKKHYAIARFHPETAVREPVEEWIKDVCYRAYRDRVKLLVFPPNRDTGWERIEEAWADAQLSVSLRYGYTGISRVDTPLPRPSYLGLLKHAKWITGNSSSFVVEAPMVGNYKVRLYGHRQAERVGPDWANSPRVDEAILDNLKQDTQP